MTLGAPRWAAEYGEDGPGWSAMTTDESPHDSGDWVPHLHHASVDMTVCFVETIDRSGKGAIPPKKQVILWWQSRSHCEVCRLCVVRLGTAVVDEYSVTLHCYHFINDVDMLSCHAKHNQPHGLGRVSKQAIRSNKQGNRCYVSCHKTNVVPL